MVYFFCNGDFSGHEPLIEEKSACGTEEGSAAAERVSFTKIVTWQDAASFEGKLVACMIGADTPLLQDAFQIGRVYFGVVGTTRLPKDKRDLGYKISVIRTKDVGAFSLPLTQEALEKLQELSMRICTRKEIDNLCGAIKEKRAYFEYSISNNTTTGVLLQKKENYQDAFSFNGEQDKEQKSEFQRTCRDYSKLLWVTFMIPKDRSYRLAGGLEDAPLSVSPKRAICEKRTVREIN